MSVPPIQKENLPTRNETPPDDHPADELPAEVINVLKDLPPEKQDEIVAALKQQIEIVHERFSGPLPHPELLREFDEVVPGCAKDIIQMTLDQGNHRRNMERIVINGQVNDSRRGQLLGFSIGIVALLVSGFLIYTGHDLAGGALGTVDIVGLVAVFVIGQNQQKKDLDNREDS